jgi:hypothetical protein
MGRPPQVQVLTVHDTTPLKTLHTRPPERHQSHNDEVDLTNFADPLLVLCAMLGPMDSSRFAFRIHPARRHPD